MSRRVASARAWKMRSTSASEGHFVQPFGLYVSHTGTGCQHPRNQSDGSARTTSAVRPRPFRGGLVMRPRPSHAHQRLGAGLRRSTGRSHRVATASETAWATAAFDRRRSCHDAGDVPPALGAAGPSPRRVPPESFPVAAIRLITGTVRIPSPVVACSVITTWAALFATRTYPDSSMA